MAVGGRDWNWDWNWVGLTYTFGKSYVDVGPVQLINNTQTNHPEDVTAPIILEALSQLTLAFLNRPDPCGCQVEIRNSRSFWVVVDYPQSASPN